MSVAVVDFSACESPEQLAHQIDSALTSVGFLFLKNHGLEAQVERMFELSANFFVNESPEEKEKSAIFHNKGYAAFLQEALDPTTEGDMKEAFNIGLVQSSIPAQLLPSILLEHVKEIEEFQHACFLFCQKLLQAFALILKLDIDFFTSQHTFNNLSPSILRLLHYPAANSGVSPNRAGAHSDYGSLTLLFQKSEGAEGLQLLPPTLEDKEKNWQDVGVVEGALLVNVGDALEFWSGAYLKSTLHRVRLPTPIPIEGIPERYSIAFFNQPDPSAILKSVVETDNISEIDLERMSRKGVKPGCIITASEHLNARLGATYKLVK